MPAYHVALSFAGEDRRYVEQVAKHLKSAAVEVFYDRFEDTTLWGKDLYSHLSDVYQNQAHFTVMFISEAYRDKLWTTHERRSAQARAFAERREYILPTYFDTSVEVPGVLRTTGYLDLAKLTAEQLAEKIIKKLREHAVLETIEDRFAYADHARADIDFPMKDDDEDVVAIVTALRSYDWYKQSPAIEKIVRLKWSERTRDEIFVLGRNIYQCACGGENRALEIVRDLRRWLAKVPADAAEHLLNGMFFEAYFNSKGKFRGSKLKHACLGELFTLQTVEKYADCIAFIRQELEPYRDQLGVLPNGTPEALVVSVTLDLKKDPTVMRSILCMDRECIVEDDDRANGISLPPEGVKRESVHKKLAEVWHIPADQVKIRWRANPGPGVRVRLPHGKMIAGSLAAR